MIRCPKCAAPLPAATKRAVIAAANSHPGKAGRPRLGDRCPCGRYTRQLAEKRGHRCEVAVSVSA